MIALLTLVFFYDSGQSGYWSQVSAAEWADAGSDAENKSNAMSERVAMTENVMSGNGANGLAPLDINRENVPDFITRQEAESLVKSLSWKKGNFTFTPYGFINAAMVYDSAKTVPGEFTLYAQSKDIDGDPDWAVDARKSRLGLFIDGPALESVPGAKLRGVLECDFYGSVNQTRNKGGLQLRKAYVELDNRADDWKLLFGQNWEIISPLYPQMLVYLPAGFCGNIGYRRAAFQVDKGFRFSENFRTLVQLGVCDDITNDFLTTSCVSCTTSGVPLLEGRVAFSFGEQARGGLPITLGFSGHYGQQRYSFNPVAGSAYNDTYKNKPIKTWSANIDLDVPFSKRFRMQGEYYLGENLSGFCGAINQGIDLFRRNGIRDQGGWLCLSTKLTDKLSNNTGYAIDIPNENDLVGTCTPVNGITNSRTRNSVYFTNLLYNWSSALMTGIELSYWETRYQRANVTGRDPVYLPMAPGEAFRTEVAVTYTF